MFKARLPKGADLLLIFASVFVAFLIWLIAKQGETDHVTLTVPIQVVNADPVCVVTLKPIETQIQIQFPTAMLRHIAKDNFWIEIDGSKARQFAGVRETSQPRQISIYDLKMKPDLPTYVAKALLPLAIVGDDLVTLLAKFHSCEISVEARHTGTPPNGYVLQRPLAADEDEISRLLLVGKPVALEEHRAGAAKVALLTKPIDLGDPELGRRAYASIIVPENCFLADADLGRLLQPEDWRVLVDVPIVEESIERVIEDVPIDIRPFSDDIEMLYSPRTASVRARGVRSLVESLAPASFTAGYSSALNETVGFKGKVAISVRFALTVPDKVRVGVTLVSYDPQDVQMAVRSLIAPDDRATTPAATGSRSGVEALN
jgi:hypothetical protein